MAAILCHGRPPKYDAEVRHKLQTRVCRQPEDQSRWSVRALAAELGLPASTVPAMLVAATLQPHRVRTFTFSRAPDFEAKLLDIVGLHLNPPENAFVLCVDEKPSMQALDRTQPWLPLRARKPCSWTKEYLRHGTQTLLAALEIATGKVVAQVRDPRTTVDFLNFMDDVVRTYPVRELHVVLAHLNVHKNEAAKQWLLRHPRVHFHYTATHASWMNLIECFFSILTRQALTQSVQRSKRPTFQERPEGFPGSISEEIQRESDAVYLDQRAPTLPAHHRRHQGVPSSPPEAAKATEE